MRARRLFGLTLAAVLASGLITACGNDDSNENTVTLVTHESFKVSDDVLDKFEKDSGLTVKILRNKDAGTAVNQAILTKDNPQGDVLFGVDNTYLSRALDEEIFSSYEANGLNDVAGDFRLDKKNRVTPIDYGDVCVNYDKSYYAERDLTPPQTLADLVDPQYKDQLVVENPATSSPGLAFLTATVAASGEDGWEAYWEQLKANGVEVVDSWEQAYYERFSEGGGDGDKPLVVSYASSPPAAVYYAENPPEEAPTGVSTGTCFRQIEFAGLLKGADNEEGGRKLIDFLLSEAFQKDMPLNMFVYPVREGTPLPEVFTKHAAEIAAPFQLPPSTIAENRDQWLKGWKSTVLG